MACGIERIGPTLLLRRGVTTMKSVNAFAMANGMGAEANFPALRLTSSDGVDVLAIRWGV